MAEREPGERLITDFPRKRDVDLMAQLTLMPAIHCYLANQGFHSPDRILISPVSIFYAHQLLLQKLEP